jgi:O-antigen/teichoic acid export membrane protein
MKTITEKTKNSLLWQTIIQPVWEVIRFILSIWIARLLDPKDFGIMGVASVIILYCNSLSELGFSNALIHKTDIDRQHVDTVFTVNLFISLVLMIGLLLCSLPIAGLFNIPELTQVLRVLSIVFILTSFSQISITLLRRELEYKRYTILSFLKGLVQIIATLILAILNYEYWALIIGTVIGELFSSVVLYYSISMKPRLNFNKNAFKSIYNYGLWNFIIAQFATIYTYAEKAIIGKYLGVSTLGLYDKAFSIAYMPVDSISVKINGVMFSSFNQFKSNKKELCQAFYNVSTFSSIICFPIFGGLISVSHDFVQIAFGDKWLPMVASLTILSIAFLFRVPIGMMSSLIMAAGDYKKYIKFQLLIFFTAIVLYFPIVDYGIESICIVITLTNAVLFIVAVYIAMTTIETMDVLQYLSSLAPATINTVIMTTVVYMTSSSGLLAPLSVLEAFIIKVVIGICVYIILFFGIRYKGTKLIRERLKKIRLC